MHRRQRLSLLSHLIQSPCTRASFASYAHGRFADGTAPRRFEQRLYFASHSVL
ncbi:hypothetical protein HETIRDRAFT_148112 [Heterobasidion irregulare TC 32-1]|uniref:Uncharacterized protein n=1 Tax=Heterobasidion irregulare (strain TC 32-1) TaxID=747525 RepID=W4JU65_HETIT|nr:uncharacterized protein HETIRDRAFT_148112 [Heterobasidion irregulare TC 32-1]ETW76630.1 hypothetical protein HETIRDRAFT_148112 [Heterobasidion irregulare TC 32-1]